MRIGEGIFDFEANGEPSEADFRMAVVLLLVVAAIRDEVFVPQELARICTIMKDYFGLSDAETAHQIDVANFCIKEESTANSILERVRSRFTISQREKLKQLMVEVIKSDGLLSADEKLLMKVASEYLEL